MFLDFNTSWCVPCRRMEAEIFTQDSVAEYLNKNFISSSYRCDTSANDVIEIRDRYPDALNIIKELNIQGYPTYAILSPDGVLVHKVIGYMRADVFIDELKMGLNPQTQYLTFVKEFNKGNRGELFLLKLVNASERVNDYVKVPDYINNYLKTQKNYSPKKYRIYR
ncbi:thioredoxin family protein [Pedobacter sp. P26]|uniref:thioredoxin family protein n=1 Tax=Pedobacter sp. P26 TaxID=3423956 RepID=UPI003D670A19